MTILTVPLQAAFLLNKPNRQQLPVFFLHRSLHPDEHVSYVRILMKEV